MVDRPRNERMEDGRGRGKDIFIRTVCIRIKVHPKWHTFLVLHMYSLCAHFSLFLILSMFSKSQPLLINCLIFYLMFALSFVHIPFLRSFSPRCFIQSLYSMSSFDKCCIVGAPLFFGLDLEPHQRCSYGCCEVNKKLSII